MLTLHENGLGNDRWTPGFLPRVWEGSQAGVTRYKNMQKEIEQKLKLNKNVSRQVENALATGELSSCLVYKIAHFFVQQLLSDQILLRPAVSASYVSICFC